VVLDTTENQKLSVGIVFSPTCNIQYILKHNYPDAGGFCKPCMCNDNVNYSSPNACDRFSGICQECLYHTFGEACERCEPWFFGDAVILKNCQKCDCEREGTELCEHTTGECRCLPGVEGGSCDVCMADHWGYNSGAPVSSPS
jgi:hypothetical protein